MSYIIPATFADDTGFLEGLTPAITIRQRDETSQSYIDKISATMDDKGLGDYVYTYAKYDKRNLYTFKIDGGNDGLTSRYYSFNNELDHYSNKEDWGSQFRGALGGFGADLNKRLIKREAILKTLEPKDVDLSELLLILNEIRDREYPTTDNEEVLDKLYELGQKDYKTDVISAININGSNLQKDNETNRELVHELVEQTKSDRELIKKLEDYINILIKRGDIKKDTTFKELVKEIKEVDEDFKGLAIYMDEDFISLMNN